MVSTPTPLTKPDKGRFLTKDVREGDRVGRQVDKEDNTKEPKTWLSKPFSLSI